MIVEPVIVDTIDKARIECNLFRGSYVVKLKGMLETSKIIVVLGSRHRGEQLADDAAFGGKCGGSVPVGERLRLRKFSVRHGVQYNRHASHARCPVAKRVLFPGLFL